jgi:hypothetical protein
MENWVPETNVFSEATNNGIASSHCSPGGCGSQRGDQHLPGCGGHQEGVVKTQWSMCATERVYVHKHSRAPGVFFFFLEACFHSLILSLQIICKVPFLKENSREITIEVEQVARLF